MRTDELAEINTTHPESIGRLTTWLRMALELLLGLLLICSLGLVLWPEPGSANEETHLALRELTPGEVTRGSLLFRTEQTGLYRPAPTLHTDVTLEVSGMIVRATVKQRFQNTDDDWVEGVYVFPLPETAAVDHMRMRIGERVIEGQIKERAEARTTYERARQQGKKASLLEQERPNMFTTSVANIGPQEIVEVEIEYQQSLRYDSGRFSLRFPLAITPRYIPGVPVERPVDREESFGGFTRTGWAEDTDQVPDASRITPPVHGPGVPPNRVSLRVKLDPGFPLARLESPYHRIQTASDGDGRRTVTLAEGDIPADRDFELVWAPSAGSEPRAALFTERVEDGFYHLLLVMPPSEGITETRPLAREVIYVIDTSGSMAGPSIAQARDALELALDRLRPWDRFNIIEFNSTTHQLFRSARVADPKNLRSAKRYVASLNAQGGTEMRPALEQALVDSVDSSLVRQIVFLTDGSVGNEAELFTLIEQGLGRSRLYTVGIGPAPNSYFMRKAAQFGRGTFTHIGDVNEVQDKMTELFGKLESPVMTGLDIELDGVCEVELWPGRVPDVYLGEPLVITARSRQAGGVFRVRGERSGAEWRAELRLDGGRQGSGVGVLWARSKIAALMDSLHEGADAAQVRSAVIRVALTHHLVSKYTSLVAVDVTPTRPPMEGVDRRAVPGNLPKGLVHEKIFGRLPQTATPARLHLLLGALLLLAASWVAWRALSRHTGLAA